MSRGLEALKRIALKDFIFNDDSSLNDIKIIKQELEALEVIRNKKVDVGYLTHLMIKHNDDKKSLQTYNMNVWTYAYEWKDCIIDKTMILTKEEYDLLREVLL